MALNASKKAKNYHSITIGTKNTWDDWFLVPSSRPVVNPPSVKQHYVTIPGKSGALDLSESFSGSPLYANRTGSWEFYVMNFWQIASDYPWYSRTRRYYDPGDRVVFDEKIMECVSPITQPGDFDWSKWIVVLPNRDSLWQERYTQIMAYLHGQEFDVYLNDDEAYYYSGRLAVDSWKSDPGNSTIVISYNLSPYKITSRDANERWLWDPFNFQTGVIKSYKNLKINGTTTVVYVLNQETTEHPIINCSEAGMTVTFDGTTYNLKRGNNNMIHMHFVMTPSPENRLVFTGNGRVTIKMTGGLL